LIIAKQSSIEQFGVGYLDGILIYRTNETRHEEQVREVLQRHCKFFLCCKAKMYQFAVLKIGFLGIVITSNGVGMEWDWISIIEDWLTPNSFREVQVLSGFTVFY
jgi:hypothetical protein